MIFDIETDGLSPTKIHCLSYCEEDGSGVTTLLNYDDMRKFFTNAGRLVGHNIIRYDIPALERILNIKIRATLIDIRAPLIDTMALSWYLYPKRKRHGLAWWGEDLGIAKPSIDDWEGLTSEEYAHRCEEDVKINCALFKKQMKLLTKLYKTSEERDRLVNYLTFKMQCAALQEADKWRLDKGKAYNTLSKLEQIKKEKVVDLEKVMPKVKAYVTRTKPKGPYKKDGSVSALGEKWFSLLEEKGLPKTHTQPIKVVKALKEPNSGSPTQVKDWLYSLGWVPETFKYDRNKETGDVRKIPQINMEQGKGICPSIKKLYPKEHNLELLDGLSVISHRITVLKGFLSNVDEGGYIPAAVQGLTNTLRFKHTVIVNLPKVGVAYGEDIRSCLMAPEGWELCGSDMSSLEDRTKQHYMWKHDPEYVKEMMTPDFDPHLDLAVSAGLLTVDQVKQHKLGTVSYSVIRHVAKTANYACTYGAGGATVARGAGISVPEGEALVDSYNKRNWALQAIADECEVKTVEGQMWLFNPVSRLWYSLRHKKDRFSTLNQGTGVWCFDTWVKHILSKRYQLTAQFHDEVVLCVRKGFRDKAEGLLRWAIEETNKELKLNRELDVDVQFGDNYAQIH